MSQRHNYVDTAHSLCVYVQELPDFRFTGETAEKQTASSVLDTVGPTGEPERGHCWFSISTVVSAQRTKEAEKPWRGRHISAGQVS